MTERFKNLLHWNGFTQETLAAAVPMGRCRLVQALNNVPGRGGVRRGQIAAALWRVIPRDAEEMLSELGWSEKAEVRGRKAESKEGWNVPRGTNECGVRSSECGLTEMNAEHPTSNAHG